MKGKSILIGLFILVAFAPAKKKIKIYLIGDSTMCWYETARAPLTGWGMPFSNFFDASVTIDNRAKGGRSTRTFLSEGRWKPVADSLQEGDYVFIQFGHNDEAKEEKYQDRYTPVADYKINLIKFITETRAKKANPVLVTPVSRMRFNKGGIQEETHIEYTAAMYEIAKQYNVPLIDLDKKSRALYQQLGPENTKLLFMQLEPAEHPNYPEGQKDNTHFNEYGARRIAELVLSGVKELNLELAERIVKGAPDKTGITAMADTSFTSYSAYVSAKKKYPDIRIVQELHSNAVIEKKNMVYCVEGARNLYIDAFYPAQKSKINHGAIMIIFGGGWRSGNRMQHYPLAQHLAALGYTCFTPDYRLSTEALYPAAVNDLKSALRWMHANAKTFDIDTNKIAVMGFSAGGELAAFIGTTNHDLSYETNHCNEKYSSEVDAIVDLDGTLSFVHPESGEGDDSKKISSATYWFGYSKKSNKELWEDASPLAHVDRHTPPTLFINSSVARMHAGRNDFIEILKKNNIAYEVKSFDDAPHAFPLFDPWFEPTVQYTDAFLRKIFSIKK